MTRSRIVYAVAVVASACLLSACGNGGNVVKESLTIEGAKSETQSVETRVIGLLPADVAGTVDQQSEGVLLACNPETVAWTGGATVGVQGSPDFEQVLDGVRDAFSGDDTYRATLTTDSFGDPQLRIETESGALWLVGPMKNGTVISISSFSPCFPTPEGMQPSDRY